MKKILSILLISIILFGCSKDPLKKSVIESLEVDEIKQILEFEDERYGCCFELFYEKVQEFHELSKNDNLIKVKFENVLYQHYFDDQDYLHNFGLTERGLVYTDSIENVVIWWKTIPKYLNIYDTLSSVIDLRERYNSYGFYSDKEIESKTEQVMIDYIQKQIETKNDSIWDIFNEEKSEKIKLLEEFENKMIEVKVKNRRR